MNMNFTKYIRLPDFGINITKLSRFFDRLASITSAGVPLLRALEILEAQEESNKFRSILNQIRSKLNAGSMFAENLTIFGKSIPGSCINIVKASEVAGNLDQGLRRAAKYLEQRGAFRGKLLRSMMYPMFVVSLSMLSLIFLFTYLLPTFSGIFDSLDTRLPLITLIVIGFGDFIARYKLFIFVSSIIVWLILFYFAKKEKGAELLDKIKLKLPVAGSITRKSIFSHISNSLGEMLDAGVPILTALEAALDMIGNRVYRRAMGEVKERVESGERLFEAMRETGRFPKILIQMVSAGEESGQLGKMFKSAAQFYEEETEQTLKVLASFIEPIATVTAGLVVGIIVMALFMPLLSMVSALE